MYMGTYYRCDVSIGASKTTLIKVASRKLFKPEMRFGRERREARKKIYRDLIACHESARKLAQTWRL